MSKPWQQALLSSGLPFENDLRVFLAAKGCVTNFEYSYLKPDETAIEREFSYDLDASYIKGGYFVNFMVECKYRHPGARWIFAPDEYGGADEFGPNDFLHVIDDFMSGKFPFGKRFPRHLAPLCNKGVELLSDGTNEKTITQALSQLAYGLAPQIASSIDHQANRWLASDQIFCHVPVVATTAELYRLNSGTDIRSIRAARELDEVATRESCLVMKYPPGAELMRYNAKVFDEHANRIGAGKLQASFHSFTKDLNHYYSVLASRRCPSAVVFVSLAESQIGLDRVFSYIDELINPGTDLVSEIKESEREMTAMLSKIKTQLGKKPSKSPRN